MQTVAAAVVCYNELDSVINRNVAMLHTAIILGKGGLAKFFVMELCRLQRGNA